MIFWVADDRHLSAIGSYHVTLGHRACRVVRAFRMNVGFQSEQEFLDGRFVEDRYKRNGFECCHNFSAFSCRHDWPAVAFLKRNLFVGVNADDEYVAELSCACEVTNVSNMKHVETSVGQNDSCARFARGRHALYQLVATHNN